MMVRNEAGDDTNADALLSTGQVARKFKITLQTLHFYESEGLVSPSRSHGRRVYDAASVARLAFIMNKRRLGLSLKAIADLLALGPLLLTLGAAIS